MRATSSSEWGVVTKSSRVLLVTALWAMLPACGPEARAGSSEGNDSVVSDAIVTQSTGCSVDEFYGALAADTAALTSRTLATQGLSTEGGEAVEYVDSAGVPRVVAAEFFGETGRVRQIFYLTGPDSYVTERTVWRYDQPITQPGERTVVRQERWVVYVCRGEPMVAPYVEEADRSIDLFRSLD